MTQLALDLPPFDPALGRVDFLKSDCNAAALAAIERWPDWPARALVLHGPPGSGKSHLAQLWRKRSAATLITGGALAGCDPSALGVPPGVAVDDADRAVEPALLHLFNCCHESGASLLVVAREAPAVQDPPPEREGVPRRLRRRGLCGRRGQLARGLLTLRHGLPGTGASC